MACVRLCLVVELTAKHGLQWQQRTLPFVVEPLLAMLEAGDGRVATFELALVLFGAHPPHSPAAVDSCLGWTASAAQLRQLMGGLQFAGGGRQPVALAEALAATAALCAVPSAPGAAPWQHHCLVCTISDPAPNPVPWPYPEDCCLARLPGLATSAELCHALRRRGVRLGAASSRIMHNEQLLWHVANMLSEAPLSLADSRAAQLKAKHDATLQRLVRATLGLPGGGMTVIPSWDAAAAALQAAGAKPLSPGTDVGGKPADGLEPLAPDPQDAAARAARGGSGNWTAATGAVRSPLQATPPGMPGATPPLLDSSPGGFLDVLNAQIYSPELDVAPPPAAAAALPLAAPPQQPAVTGLPLPPVKQEPAAAAAVASPQQAAPASGGYAVVHTARVVVDGKVMGGGAPLVLGVGQVFARAADAAALRALSWPPELRLAKTLARASANSFLQGKPRTWQSQLSIHYATPEAQAFPEKLFAQGAAAAVAMYGGLMGVLLPARNPQNQRIVLALVVTTT